jgi:hypothetical protein
MFTLMVLWEALKAASLAKTAGGQEWVAVASLHMLAPGTGEQQVVLLLHHLSNIHFAMTYKPCWQPAAFSPGHTTCRSCRP